MRNLLKIHHVAALAECQRVVEFNPIWRSSVCFDGAYGDESLTVDYVIALDIQLEAWLKGNGSLYVE